MLDVPSIVADAMTQVAEPDFAGLPDNVTAKLAENPPESWRDVVAEHIDDVVDNLPWEQISIFLNFEKPGWIFATPR